MPSLGHAASHVRLVLEADLSTPRPFLALAAVYLLARLPFLFFGYGTDPDSWRVALTGHFLLAHGQYYPSRLPGYPLQEFLVAPLVPLGSIATNLETSLVFLACVFIFARTVRLLELPQPALLTAGFAFTPLLVINSVSTMDYAWTLTCMLASYYAACRQRSTWAGVFAGLAVAARLPAAIIVPPVAYLLLRQGRARELPSLVLILGGIALLIRAPTLVVYGTHTLNFYDAAIPWQSVARLLAKEALGVLGAVGVLVGAAISWKKLGRVPRDALTDPQVGAWLMMIGLTLVVFLRLPHKIGYALPLFPFGFFLMGRYYSRPAMGMAVLAIVLAGLVDVTIHQGSLDAASFRHASLGEGLLLSNVQTMRQQTGEVYDLLSDPIPDHSVVMVGFSYPQLAVRSWRRLHVGILQKDYDAISMLTDRGETVDTDHDVRYVWLLSYDQFLSLRTQGYSFFMSPDAEQSTYAVYHYRPALMGAMDLPTSHAATTPANDLGNR